jgi:PBSX family phage terminase large subunit
MILRRIYNIMAKNKPIVWSPRSILAIATAHLCKINLFHGAVRSSKSYTADYIAIRKEISKLPPCNVLVSGFSSDSAKQNIVAEWEKKLKAEFKEHKNAKGNYFTIPIKGLHDKRFYIRGGGKNGDEKGIKGVTLGYWYADEITECTEEFIKMAISRLSLPFSKAIWTTNPSNPTNYIKTNYLDKEKLGVLKGIFQSFQFEMFDNPMLPAEYIKEAYTTYHGVFFQRNVLGKWVAAEGHIYTMCDDDNIYRN